jgi:DNA-binding CsgD family transcriptional regulator
MGRLESALTSIDALVNRLSGPVLLVDETARLGYANTAGQEALREARYVLLRAGRVRPCNWRMERQFTDLLATALSDDQRAVETNTSMHLTDSQGRPAVLIVQALHGQVTLASGRGADAVLFLIPGDLRTTAYTSRLQAMFGLTQAETRLAESMLRGKNLTEIGEELGVSRETLKSQLRSLFVKTDTHRQGELIALLLSFVTAAMG